jgi:peroxiredoxin
MKKTAIIFAAIFAFAIGAGAQALTIGGTLENLSLTDSNGKTQSLNDLKGTNGMVLIFVSAQCPVVRAYNERMNQLALDYKSKGINVIGVNANVTESAETVREHSAQTYKFPVLVDKTDALADKLGATHTPEVYFFSPRNVLLYHGAIDNDRSGRNITENYLRSAFDASLAGKKIEKTSVEAFGCSIKRSAYD